VDKLPLLKGGVYGRDLNSPYLLFTPPFRRNKIRGEGGIIGGLGRCGNRTYNHKS